MPISETIQYVAVFGITIIFSAFALTMEENKLILKMIAGLGWFIMSIVQFVLAGANGVLTIPFSMLFLGLGLVFFFSTLQDYFTKKRDQQWGFND